MHPDYGTLPARFWAKVDKRGPADCWLWTASRTTRGYGQILAQLPGRPFRPVGAHIVAAMLAGLDVSQGTVIRHSCDTPLCCNAAHLLSGTQAENLADMRAKGRHNIGARNGAARLTPEAVRVIRARVAGGDTQTTVAEDFGITRAAVGLVVTRRTWGHVPD